MSSPTNSGLYTVSLSEKIDAKHYHLQNLKEKGKWYNTKNNAHNSSEEYGDYAWKSKAFS